MGAYARVGISTSGRLASIWAWRIWNHKAWRGIAPESDLTGEPAEPEPVVFGNWELCLMGPVRMLVRGREFTNLRRGSGEAALDGGGRHLRA